MASNAKLSLVLDTGGTVELSRSASNARLFTGLYFVAAGQHTSALTVQSASATNASDAAGNLLKTATLPVIGLEAVKTIAIDAVAPLAPSAFKLDSASDSGTVGDGITSIVRPTLVFEGLEVGATVRVSATAPSSQSIELLTFTATSVNMSQSLPQALDDGVYTNFRTVQIDPAGNVSPQTLLDTPTSGVLTISTAAPVALAGLQFDANQDKQTLDQYIRNLPGTTGA